MGASTLSKLQMEQYKEIVERFSTDSTIMLEHKDEVRMRETLTILCALGYLQQIPINGVACYTKIGEFKDFDAWHKDKIREERQLSRREWRIAIVSAAIGAFIGLLPTIIPWIISLFTTNG